MPFLERTAGSLSVLAFFCACLQAQETDVVRVEALTRSYIGTVAAMDYETEATFYDEASVFEDPTSGEFGPAWHFEGGAAIVSFFRGINEEYGTLAIANEIEKLLVTPPFVIAFVKSTVTTCATALGYPTKSYTGTIDMVMALHFDGDKVRRRTDWADYPGAQRVLETIEKDLESQKVDPRCAARVGD